MPNPKVIAGKDWYGSAGGLGSYYARKSLTFNNTSGAVDLFTVTGDVIVRVIAICGTGVTSAAAGNVEVGIAGTTGAIIPTTVGTAIIANEIWHDASPDATIEALSIAGAAGFIISGGADIILTCSAQIDTGAITFHCFWTPLSSDGAVVAA